MTSYKLSQFTLWILCFQALRIIKYAVGKSGAEFRREMQRNSVAVRQLIHYSGQPDPLKGDALNKAVRETAQETLSALFTSDESKAAPTESKLGSRIKGFGNTNYELPSEEKKSFMNEIVDLGSATIKHGLSSLAQSPSLRTNNETGSYRSLTLQRSFSQESDHSKRHEAVLSLLSGEKGGGENNQVERSTKAPQPSMMPDLLDTSDSHDLMGVEDSQKAETSLGHENDFFSGMAINKSEIKDAHVAASRTESEPFDFFNSRESASQAAGINAAPMFPMGAMSYNFPPGLMFNPALASHAMNNVSMENLCAQPQFLAAMSNFQQLGHLQSSTGFSAAGSVVGNSSAFPDVFNSTIAAQPSTSLMNDSKREDTGC
ncbi:hypothetical protein SASPL_141094 [Salvia splendens]|uniref:VHS domain-containing protein n=1 Tax=Salvia splendens TaxID=180675 RepID=A0A8X8ZCJ0_SALSN|nr:hypothetical protein SASPL_141094 [Salvia splendens]